MAWIEVIPPATADGELREVYDGILSRRGKLSNIMAVQSLSPTLMRTHLDLYMTIMFEPSGLSRSEREMIAVHVSVVNGCEYCTRHHAEALRACWRSAERVSRLESGQLPDDLSDRERELLRYAEALTVAPSAIEAADIARLRAVGLSDPEILNLAAVVGYFNFVNRLAEGLGVEVTDDEVAGYRY
jgi:uncharacterized peroxidase-related enzyme